MRRSLPVSAAVAVLAGLLAGCRLPTPAPAPEARAAPRRHLSVAAASSLRQALEAAVIGFQARHPEVYVEPVYGASAELVRLVRAHAPIDLLLSADEARPRQLQEAGLASADGVFCYGVGHLALWVRRDRRLDPRRAGLALTASPAIGRLGLANGHLAPYGAAAAQALQRAGLRGQVERKLVVLENADRVAQAAAAGRLDAALLPLSLASAPALARAGRFAPLPASLAPPLRQAGIIPADAREPDLARAFRDYLLGPGARALSRAGLDRPPP